MNLQAAQKVIHQGSDPTAFMLSKTCFVLHTITREIRGTIATGKARLNISKRRQPSSIHELETRTTNITSQFKAEEVTCKQFKSTFSDSAWHNPHLES